MSKTPVVSWGFAFVVGLSLVGCGGGAPLATNEPDPVQQAVEKKVKAKGDQVIPPGHMMNSGGEIVPVEAAGETDLP